MNPQEIRERTRAMKGRSEVETPSSVPAPVLPTIQEGFVIVPRPPDLRLKPERETALVTIAVGESGREWLEVSSPLMRRYADRLGADFVVLDWPGHPDWPMSAKFAIPRVLDYYKRIAYVDADVILRPGCMNLFEACREDEIGFVDELQYHRQQPNGGHENGYLAFREDMGFKSVPHLPWMANCGVMVVPASHKELLLPPTRPIRATHCGEQDHTTARVLDSGMKYRILDQRCNWQFWLDPDFRSTPPEAVLHWAGMSGTPSDRAASMRERIRDIPPYDDIPGWFNFMEFYDLLVTELRDGDTFVEAGVWFGKSIVYLARAIRRSGKRIKLYAVDTWEGVPDDPYQQGTYLKVIGKGVDPYKEFLKNVEAAGVADLITPLRMTVLEASTLFPSNSVRVFFHDADHRRSQVRVDLDAWESKTVRGGRMCGHDYYRKDVPILSGVKEAVDEKFGSRVEIVGDPSWSCWSVIV